jgi:hypothetical protein
VIAAAVFHLLRIYEIRQRRFSKVWSASAVPHCRSDSMDNRPGAHSSETEERIKQEKFIEARYVMGTCGCLLVALLLFMGGCIFFTKATRHGEGESTPPDHSAPMDRR